MEYFRVHDNFWVCDISLTSEGGEEKKCGEKISRGTAPSDQGI
jgi:hypothetical protein